MQWHLSHRAHPRARALADRHYSRQTIGATQFAPPGRCLVLLTAAADALWVTSWPRPEYVQHAWPDSWMCSLFRNESDELSSELVVSAVAATRWFFGDPPALGMITLVNADKVRPKRDPGRCFRKAGFQPCGYTKSGLVVLQLLPDVMPAPAMPYGSSPSLFATA